MQKNGQQEGWHELLIGSVHDAEGERDTLRSAIPGTQLDFQSLWQQSPGKRGQAQTCCHLAGSSPATCGVSQAGLNAVHCALDVSLGLMQRGATLWAAACSVHLKSFGPTACLPVRILESQAYHHHPKAFPPSPTTFSTTFAAERRPGGHRSSVDLWEIRQQQHYSLPLSPIL